MSKTYTCQKNDDREVIYIDSTKITGFKVKPKNNIKYGGIKVSNVLLIKPHLIESVIKKKIYRQINDYLNFIVLILNDEDETDSSDVTLVLEDVIKYRKKIMNKYSKYLKTQDIKKIMKKMVFIEVELKEKLDTLSYDLDLEKSIGRGR